MFRNILLGQPNSSGNMLVKISSEEVKSNLIENYQWFNDVIIVYKGSLTYDVHVTKSNH